MTNEIKFMYNGIKINGKLIKGFLSKANYTNGAKYCFYADSYCSRELREYFNVKNDSDIMTDYFEEDKVYFYENDKRIKDIDNAFNQREIRNAKRAIKRLEKVKETRPDYFERYYKADYENYKKVLEVA